MPRTLTDQLNDPSENQDAIVASVERGLRQEAIPHHVGAEVIAWLVRKFKVAGVSPSELTRSPFYHRLSWIPIVDGTPKVDAPVLVVFYLGTHVDADRQIQKTFLHEDGWFDDVKSRVTHWLPIPELPPE